MHRGGPNIGREYGTPGKIRLNLWVKADILLKSQAACKAIRM